MQPDPETGTWTENRSGNPTFVGAPNQLVAVRIQGTSHR